MVLPRTKSEGISDHSHGRDRMLLRIGLPFCRGETRIAEGAARFGRAWGFGCWIVGALVSVLAAMLAVEAPVGAYERSAASTAAVKSASSPKSSSILALFVCVSVVWFGAWDRSNERGTSVERLRDDAAKALFAPQLAEHLDNYSTNLQTARGKQTNTWSRFKS